MTFDELGLSDEVLSAVADAGYERPTPIQEQAIPHVLMGRDILGCAQTGTGKTASFTLPMIDILAQGRARARMPRSLILTPTRELAAQIAENFEIYGKYHKLTMALLIGGESFGPQVEKLERGVDVLIATPGRLIDHFERGGVLLNGVKILVIDEADRMLDMGFIPDVERIVSFLPKIRQTLFFSATFPPEVKRLSDSFLINPREITVTPTVSTAETVEHFLVRSRAKDYEKRETLRRILAAEDVKNALIFCNRKRDVDTLARSLKRHGFSAAPLHGDMAQAARTETLDAFKAGTITYLVATDVAGRGLDIVGLSHVFNFDVPFHAEDYVHRIGRTGRAGAKGHAIMLATRADGKYVDAIQRLIGQEIPPLPGVEASKSNSAAEEEAAEKGPEPQKRASRSRGRRGARSESQSKASSRSRDRTKKADGAKSASAPKRADKDAAKKKTASDSNSGRRTKGRKSGPAQDRVVGLGDHMPAFLARDPRKSR
ncbi:MAG: DEAD/DEAH box helicase [Alphaproteobacteria bacterium]|nr:DEAD/DEAH box helicase [Alphaproteobacteria bacterium]